MFSTNPCRQLRWGADGDTCFAMLRALCGMPNVDSAIQESCQSSLRGKHRTCSCHIMWYNVMCNCMRVYIYIIILYYIILWHIILYYIKLYYYIYIIMCVCACCLLTCGRTTKERERESPDLRRIMDWSHAQNDTALGPRNSMVSSRKT